MSGMDNLKVGDLVVVNSPRSPKFSGYVDRIHAIIRGNPDVFYLETIRDLPFTRDELFKVETAEWRQ